MENINKGLGDIGWGLFFLGIFLGLGMCSMQDKTSTTDFQFCYSKLYEIGNAEKKMEDCFDKLKQVSDK